MSAFLDRLKVRNRIWAMVFIFVAGILLGGVVDLLSMRQALWAEKELKTRHLVEAAYGVLARYHDLQRTGALTEAAAKDAAIGAIRAMRYDGTEYFWLNDLGTPYPRMIMHPTLPALDGQVLAAPRFDRATGLRFGSAGPLVATDGRKNLFVAVVEVAIRSGQGYVTYDWPKPLAGGGATEALYPKLSFVKKFAPWGWVIGSGVYIDDVDQALQARGLRTLLLTAGVGGLLSLFALILARSITRPLQATVAAMHDIGADEEGRIRPLPVDGANEIARLAAGFNAMLARIQARDAELARHRRHLEEEVASRTVQLREANKLLEQELAERRILSEALRQTDEAIVIADPEQRFVYVNPAFDRLFGYPVAEVAGQPITLLASPDGRSGSSPEDTARIAREQGRFRGEALRRSKDGRDIPVLVDVSPVRDEAGAVVSYVATMTDLTELKHAETEAGARLAELTRANAELRALNDKLEQAQNQLMQSEKLASIGQLAAGVAHEINNPVGYVYSNLGTLREYLRDIFTVADAYEKAEASLDEASRQEILAIKQRVDFGFLRQDAQATLAESREGLDRVNRIVRDLKDFAHVYEGEEWQLEDLHKGLESTLNVVWNELKYKCELHREYGELPLVECRLPYLNQVFMNLLTNAAQAIDGRGTITLRSGTAGDRVWLEVADTGAGIPPEHLSRLFDPFFTTKPVGQGTGLGLSVAYDIVRKHHGEITVESRVGQGTVFRIWLPARQPAA